LVAQVPGGDSMQLAQSPILLCTSPLPEPSQVFNGQLAHLMLFNSVSVC
jgi:hypothetical protein